jgi:hypothetical protein
LWSGVARSRGHDWPKATAGGVRRGLDGGEHGASLAQVRARVIVSPAAEVLLPHHQRPTDPRHFVGERTGDNLAFLGQGSSLARLLHSTDIAPLTSNRRRYPLPRLLMGPSLTLPPVPS